MMFHLPRFDVTAALLCAALLLAAAPARAQSLLNDEPPVPDHTPAPPAYSTEGLIEIERPPGVSLRMGIDPASIQLDPEAGIVRYVMVAQGASSAINASYEAIRCRTGEFRVYARQIQSNGQVGEWLPSRENDWRPIKGQHSVMARHPVWLGRNGMCLGPTLPDSVGQIVRDLKTGHGSLYQH